MPALKREQTLKDFQQYVREIEEERGFTKITVLEDCLLLGEEVGELFKAVRRVTKLRTDSLSNRTEVDEELADILIYLCAIANRLGVDLETAFREKEEVNKQRVWH
jgi:NTP pyrophosphatase (non-canonical NTP hydrolase)